MKRSIFLVLSLFGMVSIAPAQVAESPKPLPVSNLAARQLRVMTYNILGGRNTDGKRDLTKVAEVIRRLNPDIVAMQEVDVKTKRINGIDVPVELAKLCGMKSAFAEAMPFSGGSYGCGVLTKLEITKQATLPLPFSAGQEPRVALEVHCTLPQMKSPFVFVATHLSHLDDQPDRGLQVAKLLETFTATSLPGPAILAGDLNADLDTPELAKLSPFWTPTWPADKPGLTFPSDGPKVRIDHILVQATAGWIVKNTFRGDTAFSTDPTWLPLLQKVSDHLPVVLEVEWKAPAEAK